MLRRLKAYIDWLAQNVWLVNLDKDWFTDWLIGLFVKIKDVLINRFLWGLTHCYFLTVLIIVYSYSSAAKCYAQTQVSFEEVALKFIQVEERQALRMFLLKKLDSLKNQVRTSVIYLTTSSPSFYSRIEDRAKHMHPRRRWHVERTISSACHVPCEWWFSRAHVYSALPRSSTAEGLRRPC